MCDVSLGYLDIPKQRNPRRIITFLPTFIKTKEAINVPKVLTIETKEDMRCPIYPEINLTEIA